MCWCVGLLVVKQYIPLAFKPNVPEAESQINFVSASTPSAHIYYSESHLCSASCPKVQWRFLTLNGDTLLTLVAVFGLADTDLRPEITAESRGPHEETLHADT